MRGAALLLGAGLGAAACSSSPAAAPGPAGPALAASPAPKPKSWLAEIDAVAARAYAMPAPPLAASYVSSDDPGHLAENVSSAAKFIAASLAYQRAALSVPSGYWNGEDRSRFEENRRQVEAARRVLAQDSAGLLR